jgi:hypothetical protein
MEWNAVWVSLLPGLSCVKDSKGPQLLSHDFVLEAFGLSG